LKISVIFSTYNSPAWLQKVLLGFHYQTDENFEIVIADDGSSSETRLLIEQFKSRSHIPIKHIWQEDNGFQKCSIINKAIVASEGEYLILTDGDCIPRKDFVSTHRSFAEPGYFLSGGYLKLPMHTSQIIDEQHIKAGLCFDKKWLINNGLKNSHKLNKLSGSKLLTTLLNKLTPTKRTWNGHNASCFKSAALHVNGFDERMQYGRLDCEFGGRLKNSGLKTKQIRYSAICIHLDHAKSYENAESWEKNKKIRETSVNQRLIETPQGIKQASNN